MSELFTARVGGVISADIAVPEHEREVAFYASVLGTGDTPLWRDDLMNDRGIPIIGLGERTAELEILPLQWMPHIMVADVAASAQAALDRGGRELMHGKDDDGNSLWAAFVDPNGAAFGIIPVVPPEAMPPVEEGAMGCIGWLDLTVPDAAATRDFYKDVVGWTAEDVGMKDGDEAYADYNMCGGDGKPAGGVCHARGTNADVPATWMMYLYVGDLGESLRQVEARGGTIVKASKNKDGDYVYAMVQDPVGAYFGLVPA